MANVNLTTEAQQEFEKLPHVISIRVLHILERLEKYPEVSGAKPMRGDLAGYFRIRTGAYRVLFTMKGDDVWVTRIGIRRGFYED